RVEGAAGEDHLACRPDLTRLAGGAARRSVGAVEPLALEIGDADRSVAVEEHPRRKGIELDAKAIRTARSDVEEAVARPDAAMTVRRERGIAEPLDAGSVPAIVGVEDVVDLPPQLAEKAALGEALQQVDDAFRRSVLHREADDGGGERRHAEQRRHRRR